MARSGSAGRRRVEEKTVCSTAMLNRLDDVAQPPKAGEWLIQFGTSEAASEWPELCAKYPGIVGMVDLLGSPDSRSRHLALTRLASSWESVAGGQDQRPHA